MSRVASAAAVTLQSWTRSVSAQKQLSAFISAVTIIQSWSRLTKAQKQLNDAKSAATTLQCWSRSSKAQKQFRAAIAAVIALQCWVRSTQAQKKLKNAISAAITLQCWSRSVRAQKQLATSIAAATTVQSWARSIMAKKELEKARRIAAEKERALNVSSKPFRVDVWIRRFFLVAALIALAGMTVSHPRTIAQSRLFNSAKSSTSQLQQEGIKETSFFARIAENTASRLSLFAVKEVDDEAEEQEFPSTFAGAIAEPFRRDHLEYATKFNSHYL